MLSSCSFQDTVHRGGFCSSWNWGFVVSSWVFFAAAANNSERWLGSNLPIIHAGGDARQLEFFINDFLLSDVRLPLHVAAVKLWYLCGGGVENLFNFYRIYILGFWRATLRWRVWQSWIMEIEITYLWIHDATAKEHRNGRPNKSDSVGHNSTGIDVTSENDLSDLSWPLLIVRGESING